MPKLDGSIGSQILDEGMTPAQWIEILASRECVISERTLREKANDKGAFYRLGRAMLITPAQIDIIFEEGQPCRSQSTRGADITTSTDTWWREIVTPASAVINNAHELEGTPLIRVKPYDKFERIAQDRRRGKLSSVERTPSDKEWIEAFCNAADLYNAALVRFMFETAARIDQAVSLELDDLKPVENKVRVKAQKGHPESWITVSPEMIDELLALPAKRPKNRKTGKFMKPRVFGYGSSTGYNTRWKTICKRAGIQYLSAHPAGRHGFLTELVVRQGVDPVTAAEAGRWADPTLPMRIYAHAETDEADIKARFRTNNVQEDPVQTAKQRKSKKE